MTTKEIHVIKASGDRELFDPLKLISSLSRAGATVEQARDIIVHIEKELEDEMTTDHIYRHAFSILKRTKNPSVASRYSLRRALLELGPTGFPFEKFLGQLMKHRGYEIAVNQMLLGRCVPHEMDVVAYNEKELIMIESKFHNHPGEKSDLKVALYVKARFDDLLEQHFDYGKKRLLDKGWLVTNTKFTENAIRYGECSGLTMIGWNYPKTGSIRDFIVDTGLHPVTCISEMSSSEKQLLLNNGMVLCRQIIDAQSELSRLGIGKEKIDAITAEAREICGS